MSRILFLLLLLLAFCGSHATSTQRDTLVHFASDEHALTADAIARLDAFLATIDKQADIEFSIAGHTDSDASRGYNEQLALRRSHAVREYLVAHGVPAEAITLRAFGERKAIASNNDEEGQATNRRVQVTCTLHQWETTADLQARLREGSEQTFSIDPSMDQTITTAAGIVLELPALALVDANGLPVTSTVRLNVTDALGLDAILGHELSTRSGDQLIETAGMVKVEAIGSDGAALQLDPTKPLSITLPASTQKDGMQLFLSNDGSDWNTAATSVTRSWTFTEPFLFAAKSPELKWPAMRKLDYHAPKNTLRKPIEPVYPREPKEPQRERFNSTYRWYRFVSRETLRHTDELRFAKALEQHTHALEKHTRRVAQYEEECAAYPQALEDFAAKTKAWEKEKLEHYAQWQKDVWQNRFGKRTSDKSRPCAPERQHPERMARGTRQVRRSLRRTHGQLGQRNHHRRIARLCAHHQPLEHQPRIGSTTILRRAPSSPWPIPMRATKRSISSSPVSRACCRCNGTIPTNTG
ncbi:MAG: OmpA family protein [Flavobacteriales bacterium]|nr:OmpA family protein [Flavobacteriales bacterium]